MTTGREEGMVTSKDEFMWHTMCTYKDRGNIGNLFTKKTIRPAIDGCMKASEQIGE